MSWKMEEKKSVKFCPSDKNNFDCILHCPLKKISWNQTWTLRYAWKYIYILKINITTKIIPKFFFSWNQKMFRYIFWSDTYINVWSNLREQILVKVSTFEKLKIMSAERIEENIYVEVPIQMNCPRCGKEMWTKVKSRPLEKGDKGCWSRFFCWVRNIFLGSKS